MNPNKLGKRPPFADNTFTHAPESGELSGLYYFINQLWSSTKDHGGFSIDLDKKIVLYTPKEASGITNTIMLTIDKRLPNLKEDDLADLIKYVADLHKHPSVDHE